MKDYIKEGLQARLAPPAIYEKINKLLENTDLTEEERNELVVQRDKAKELSEKMKDIFR